MSDYILYKIIKVAVLCLIALIIGIYDGITGTDRGGH